MLPRPLPFKGVVTLGEGKHKRKESLGHVLYSAAVEKRRTWSWVPEVEFSLSTPGRSKSTEGHGKENIGRYILAVVKRTWLDRFRSLPIPFLAWPGNSGFLKFYIPKQSKRLGRATSFQNHRECKSYTMIHLCTGGRNNIHVKYCTCEIYFE